MIFRRSYNTYKININVCPQDEAIWEDFELKHFDLSGNNLELSFTIKISEPIIKQVKIINHQYEMNFYFQESIIINNEHIVLVFKRNIELDGFVKLVKKGIDIFTTRKTYIKKDGNIASSLADIDEYFIDHPDKAYWDIEYTNKTNNIPILCTSKKIFATTCKGSFWSYSMTADPSYAWKVYTSIGLGGQVSAFSFYDALSDPEHFISTWTGYKDIKLSNLNNKPVFNYINNTFFDWWDQFINPATSNFCTYSMNIPISSVDTTQNPYNNSFYYTPKLLTLNNYALKGKLLKNTGDEYDDRLSIETVVANNPVAIDFDWSLLWSTVAPTIIERIVMPIMYQVSSNLLIKANHFLTKPEPVIYYDGTAKLTFMQRKNGNTESYTDTFLEPTIPFQMYEVAPLNEWCYISDALHATLTSNPAYYKERALGYVKYAFSMAASLGMTAVSAYQLGAVNNIGSLTGEKIGAEYGDIANKGRLSNNDIALLERGNAEMNLTNEKTKFNRYKTFNTMIGSGMDSMSSMFGWINSAYENSAQIHNARTTVSQGTEAGLFERTTFAFKKRAFDNETYTRFMFDVFRLGVFYSGKINTSEYNDYHKMYAVAGTVLATDVRQLMSEYTYICDELVATVIDMFNLGMAIKPTI